MTIPTYLFSFLHLFTSLIRSTMGSNQVGTWGRVPGTFWLVTDTDAPTK